MAERLDLKRIALKWQRRWAETNLFKTENSTSKKPFYCLEMFPYPSGYLHMGHVRNYSLGDVFARFKRMQGFNVLYPMGYDSFGLPAENAAIKEKKDPKEWTEKNIQGIKAQQQLMGLSYDWSRELATSQPEYYTWNQLFFLKLFEKGLAYKKRGLVNWCPTCNTVLANEQVVDGKCWRHTETEVEQRELDQWYLKITDYAEELLADIEKLTQWPERVKAMQKNWIGRSEGTDIHFTLEGSDRILSTFTTRCDTIYSVTFLVVAPEHPLVKQFVKGTEYETGVMDVVEQIRKQSELERTSPEGKNKIGAFLGKYAINPVNGEKIPIWVANFVMMYGTGIVMADAHDQRDFEFAQKYNIPLKFVISDDGAPIDPQKASRAFLSDGKLFDSGEWTGMSNREALPLISTWLEKKKWGKRTINYKLRDWLISRQRYWGTPIPIIYCETCGPVAETNLPVILPDGADFQAGGNPLATVEGFVNVPCPKCKQPARRETDTMDTFFDSSWYFLRFCDPQNQEAAFEKKIVNNFMPVDQYIGGIEHAVMHLLYARFFTKALRDLGLIDIDEPFKRLLTLGMVTKDGAKMSKSVGNVVDPSEIIEKYGPDTARLFILFAALPEKELEWSDEGIDASYRFLNRINALFEHVQRVGKTKHDAFVQSKLHSSIKKITEELEGFRFSVAIQQLMELTTVLAKYKEQEVNGKLYDESLDALLCMLSPIAPHLSEELWEARGNEGFVSTAPWPTFDERLIDEKIELSYELIEGVKGDMRTVLELAKLQPQRITLFIAPAWKYDFVEMMKTSLERTNDQKQIIAELMGSPLKAHGQEVMKLIPAVMKDRGKLPKVLLSKKEEMVHYASFSSELSSTFGCEVLIEDAELSEEQKAKQAMPGKPAILVA